MPKKKKKKDAPPPPKEKTKKPTEGKSPKEKYFPDAAEPHIHIHKGGATYTNTRHKHKKLMEGTEVMAANCRSVISELEDGTDREKSIAKYIKDKIL